MTAVIPKPVKSQVMKDSFTPDASKFSLDGLFTDISADDKETTVYANNNMQARVYIGYSYDDDVDDTNPDVLAALDNYIKTNIVFHLLDDTNTLHDLTSDWQASATDNGYEHCIDYTSSDTENKSIYGRRTPYFLIPPAKEAGSEYKLCATLTGTDEQTEVDAPLVIHTHYFEIEDSDFEIHSLGGSGGATLRVLRYVHNGGSMVPDGHRIKKITTYKGMNVNNYVADHEPNAWIAMTHAPNGDKAGIIVEGHPKNIYAGEDREVYYYYLMVDIQNEDEPPGDWIQCNGSAWDQLKDMDASEADDGIAMVLLTSVNVTSKHGAKHKLDFHTKGYELIDNYGNHVNFDIDWGDFNSEDDWYGNWKVCNVEPVRP